MLSFVPFYQTPVMRMFTLLRQLIQELAEYEKCPEGPTITVDDLEKDGFGAKPYFQCKVIL